MQEDEEQVLDLVRVTADAGDECDRIPIIIKFGFREPPELADAALSFDLWLVQQDADGYKALTALSLPAGKDNPSSISSSRSPTHATGRGPVKTQQSDWKSRVLSVADRGRTD
jgi:hypothetical protein